MKTNLQFLSEQLPYFKVVAKRSLPNRYIHLADDLAQDAILKAIEKLHKYDSSKGNFKNWLYRLTQNHCFDAIRKMDKMETLPINSQVVANPTEHRSLDRQDLKKIRKAMEFLSERDRMLITYRLIFDLSGKEISAQTGIPENQVNVYFKRAKERLQALCKVA
jgi:RNA polymerase sigma factor (sigma-70 family)